MTAYILRRLLLMVPTLFGITLVVFLLVHLVPGGPVEQAIQRIRGVGGGGESGGGGGGTHSGMTDEAVAALRSYYGFDRPIHLRYLSWLGKVVRLDFGTSYNYKQPVWELLKARIPVSFFIAGVGFLLTYAVCIPLGVIKAIHHRTWKDVLSSVLVFLGFAIPEFALGMLLLVLLSGGSFWEVFPLGGISSDDYAGMTPGGKVLDVLWHLCLPLVCYTVRGFATVTVLMKNSLMENLNADYLRTALAKGLSFRRALYRHALRNSLIPIATGFGAHLAGLLSGALLIEVVFNIRGMGLLSYEAILQRDYPVTLAVILVLAFLTLLGNLVSDVLYVFIDPRISYERSA